MTKKTRLIMSIIVLSILSSIVVTSIPSVKAAEPTSQQKTILTLENVLGVDLSHYNISTSLYSSDLYQGNLPQDTVYTILSSPSSNLDTRCTFVKGSLQMIYVSTNEGSPSAKLHGADTITMARDFLSNYQVQTGNSFYQELSSMIVKEDINTNTSKISQNIKLNITSVSEGMTFRWTYVCNGIEAPNKCVALRYENGFLKYFIDNWNLYPISNTKITLSESEAIEIAISKVKLYSPDSSQPGTIGGIKFNVTNGMIVEKLFAPSIYVDADKARGQDALELYPMYHVWVCLDKFYPGYVYGFNVYVWADTKEVCYIHQRISTMEPPIGLLPFAGNENASTEQPEALTSEGAFILALPLIALTVFTGVFLSSVSAYVLLEKKPFSFKGLTKLRRFKISRLLLCLLVLSPLLVTVISEPVMGATGGASVWGSESSASRNPPNTGESWRKSNDEVGAQQCLALYIASLFTNNSYNFPGPEIDNQGVQNSGSNKDAILSKITYLASNYPQMAVVDFDHGVGNIVNGEFHYMIEDQRGTFTTTTFHPEPADHPEYGVYDQEIYNHTTDNTFFAFINTCLSARIDQWVDTYHGIEYPVMGEGGFVNGTHAQGMPFAWMHKAVVSNPSANEMSSDGYHAYTKDNGPDCYIGFPMGSAALNETVENCGYQYWYWVSRFFYHALAEDNTIHNALDLATHDAFSGDTDFDESSLWNGFTSLWPTYRDGEWHNSTTGENSRMAVYGNADIKLYQPRVNFSAFCDTSGHENDVLYPQFTVGGETHYCGNQRLIGKTYSVSVELLHNYAFSHFSFNGQNYAQGNIPLTSDGNLVAHYIWDPVYYNLSISSSGSGYTSPSGVQSCLSYNNQSVTAYPAEGYIHYWILDNDYGNPVFSPTIEVYMDGAHSLQAFFVARPDYNFPAYVTDSVGTAYDVSRLTGIDNDGQYATLEGWGPYGFYGSVTARMYFPAGGHIYAYGYSWDEGPLYTYVSQDGYDWDYVGSVMVYDDLGWIDCGVYDAPFNYVRFTVEYPYNVYNVYLDSVRVVPLFYHDLSVSCVGQGFTSPSGTVQYENGTYAGVTAYPAPAWLFSYWTLDGQYAGSNPAISVGMTQYHSLVAHFVEAQSLEWVSVNAYDDYLGPDYTYAPAVYVDGYYVGVAPVSLQVAVGRDHWVTVDYSVYSEYWFLTAYLNDFTGTYNGYSYECTVFFSPSYSTTINAEYLPW